MEKRKFLLDNIKGYSLDFLEGLKVKKSYEIKALENELAADKTVADQIKKAVFDHETYILAIAAKKRDMVEEKPIDIKLLGDQYVWRV